MPGLRSTFCELIKRRAAAYVGFVASVFKLYCRALVIKSCIRRLVKYCTKYRWLFKTNHTLIWLKHYCFFLLLGVGVGDASASPTAAILLSVLQESMGRVATILFAHKLGTSLEPECKMYRLAADIFNDSAMVLDCLSPALPKTPRVVILGFSSILRALCGVAAGSSKASLSAHFAKWGNLGELNAVGAFAYFFGHTECFCSIAVDGQDQTSVSVRIIR